LSNRTFLYYNKNMCKPLFVFTFALMLAFIIFAPAAAFSQESDFWICVGGDISMYSYMGLAYGGSFAIGYGSGSSFGLKVAYFFNQEGIDTLEICLLLRFYLQGKNAYSGPFLQFLGGPSLYNRTGSFAIPSNVGMISAGLGFGWRFLFANRWFVEPVIRAGYPYIFGATVSAGVRF